MKDEQTDEEFRAEMKELERIKLTGIVFLIEAWIIQSLVAVVLAVCKFDEFLNRRLKC